MARKAQSPTSGQAQSQGRNAAGGQPLKKGAKTEKIRELYGRGITTAAEIRAAMNQEGMSVSDPVIYQTLSKLKKGGGKGKRGGRRKVTTDQGGAEQPQAPAKKTGPGLQPEDLIQLTDIAKKAGGWDCLQNFISVMKRMGG